MFLNLSNLEFRDPEYFEHPEIFDPSRFEKENADNIKKMSFLAFGEGKSKNNFRLRGKLIFLSL